MAPTQERKALSPQVPGRPEEYKGGDKMNEIISMIANLIGDALGNMVEEKVSDKLNSMNDDDD